MNRLPETNTGVVTSWIPITTAYPPQPGCEGLLWKYVPDILAAWDPGYGVYVNQDASCLPKPATTWWMQDHLGPIKETIVSLGPVTCPKDYYTATASAKDASSTYVACCPINYEFVGFFGPGSSGQCTSKLGKGSVATYAQRDPDWKITTSSVTADTTVVGIPVNGWVFAVPTASGTDGAKSCDASVADALANHTPAGNTSCAASGGSGLSTGATAGIGVGVSLGVTGLAALGAAIFMMYRTRKAARMKHTTADTAQFASSGGKGGMDASAQAFPTHSITPQRTSSLSERPQYHPYERDPWDASTTRSPPTQSSTYTNIRTVPHGEMEGTSRWGMDEETRARMEMESTVYRDVDRRTIGAGTTDIRHHNSDEGMSSRRTELEGEFDRSVKVSLLTPWLAAARPVPPYHLPP